MKRATVINFIIAGVIFWSIGIDRGNTADRMTGAGCMLAAGVIQICDVIGRIRRTLERETNKSRNRMV